MGRRQAGFSMIELVIAMVVTLIVTGSVYELMTAGQTAFKREPEMADRQQNARVAMDVISRDILVAGSGVPGFVGVFGGGLDGAGPMGAGGTKTDDITMARAAECGALQVCRWDAATNQAVTRAQLGQVDPVSGEWLGCFPQAGVFPIMLGGTETVGAVPRFGIYWATHGVAGAIPSCQAAPGDRNGYIDLDTSRTPIAGVLPSTVPAFVPVYALRAMVVAYQVRMDPSDPTTPLLQRSTLDGQVDPSGGPTWVTIARGIEDLQIQYFINVPYPSGTWLSDPPAPVVGDPTTVVRRVRVTVGARALDAAHVAGQTRARGLAAGVVTDAIRGELTSEIVPRSLQTSVAIAQGEM